jgi:hypothetical protein
MQALISPNEIRAEEPKIQDISLLSLTQTLIPDACTAFWKFPSMHFIVAVFH